MFYQHHSIRCFCLLLSTCFVWNTAHTSQSQLNTYQESSYFFYQQPEYPRDCNEIQNGCSGLSSSGVYLIKPDGYTTPFEVFCTKEVDSGGWTVVQRRMDGSISFNRNWEEFQKGFGFLSSEFWLGNEKLSHILNQASYELRIDMMLSNGSSFYIGYNVFRIADEWSNYALASVGEYIGNESLVITSCPPDTVFISSMCEPVHDTEIFTDCYHAYQTGRRGDGIYNIRPSGWTGESFKAPCNMSIDGGGWTVLQRRANGSVNFERNWEEYKRGFGILDHELWLGNDKIYYLTNQKNYRLRMDMVNLDGNAYYAEYSLFRITDENSKYQLVLGAYDSASTAGYDSMDRQRNQFFSTPDSDNDIYSDNCAAVRRSAWWYKSCDNCDFNRPSLGSHGHYLSPFWYYLPGDDFLLYTDIKIRPV